MNKILKYIDCNGVIIDTETNLFDEYYRLKALNPSLTKQEYLENLDWDEWIRQAPVLNNSIELLKEHDPSDTIILTKISSLHEGVVKIDHFRNLGIKNSIVLVPYALQKNQIVNATGHILIDNSQKNLDYWYEAGGIPVLYSEQENIFFPTTSSLEDVLSERILDSPKVKSLQKKRP